MQTSLTVRGASAPWPLEQLNRIVAADDLKVAPWREGGQTPGTPTWIWCVAVNAGLYVRAYSGRQSRWFQAALRQQAGQIVAAGRRWNVSFEAVDQSLNAELMVRIDDAYRAKYAESSYLAPMIGSRARAATVRIQTQE